MRRARAAGRRRHTARLLAVLSGLIAGPSVLALPVGAQEVRLADAPRSDAQRALQAFLERGTYELWTRDTVLARGDTVRSDVLLLEGSARIAGRVDGDLYVVDGDLFLRTRGSIGGDVVVLGGGFYDSDLAEVEGAITYRPNERVRVRPTQGDYEVISEIEPLPAFEADGTSGVRLPTYSRVDALTLALGGVARLMSAPGRPDLEAVVRYKTAPAEFDGFVRNSWYLSDRLRLGLFGGRETRSNDAWIRPTWYNSLAHFVAGDDNRDYYRVDEVGVDFELVSPEPPIWVDAATWRFTVSAGWEDAESLAAHDVVVLFGADAIEPVPPATEPIPPYGNPAIDDGSLFFARAGFEWSKRGRDGRAAFGVGLEAGFEDDIVGGETPGPEFNFLLVEGRVSARRITSWGHSLDVFGIGRADLAGTLPRQRYSTIGGVGTLPTMPLRGLRDARMLYAEATYAVPLLGMAALGGLDAFLRASGGGVAGDEQSFHLETAITGGVAARLWDFQMEFGVAVGSTDSPADSEVVAFFDVRVRRSARPSQMSEPGRSW